MEPISIGVVADRFSALEPLLPAGYFARQLRGLAQKGLLAPVGRKGSGRTAAALLDEEQVCRARLLSALARLGLQPGQLQDVVRVLDYIWLGGRGDAKAILAMREFEHGFRDIIERIRAGEQWFFNVHLSGEAGSPSDAVGKVTGGFTREPFFKPRGWMSLATVVLDVSDLLLPLLGELSPSVTTGDPIDER
jgi:hypothetical protein